MNNNMYGNMRSFLKNVFYEEIKPDPRVDSIHGFRLLIDDLSEEFKANFKKEEEIHQKLYTINNLGYISVEAGAKLKEIYDDPNYDLYTKGINENQLETLLNDGIPCMVVDPQTINNNPYIVNQIPYQGFMTKINDILLLFEIVKKNCGLTQGNNLIDGTLVIQIPKNAVNSDVLYFNKNTNTYNIKPEYLKGFLPVNHSNVVRDWVLPKNSNTPPVEPVNNPENNQAI